MNLSDILSSAQGGNGVEMLARQFNLSPQQAQEAVNALLPAFSQGLKQNAADPYNLGSFLSALSSGQHAGYFEDAASAFTPQGMAEGNGILGHLFGSKDVSRAVAEQASQATGIGSQILKQMLPAIATMLMGGMAQQTNNQMAAGGFGSSNNPLGDLIDQMMRQGGAQPRSTPQPQQTQGGDNPFGKMLEEILGGAQSQTPGGRDTQTNNPLGNNPLGEILGQILRGGQPQNSQPQTNPRTRRSAPQPTPDSSSNNPWGDILGQILQGQQPDADSQPTPRPTTTRSNNPLEDIFGKMVEPGKQMSDDYQKGIGNIFEQYRRGLDRYR
ncbi:MULTISPECIES: DUF937 domain-containing protein [Mesorhizobium]|uniref:DUF937 domain-containing protein n=1 Tax=Mesorhizobium denitrificans TaxID=2294114 RepID=A0A371XCV2_9HYPH|nr:MULTISPECIES: DUF937 domain-containing protein [Mesorhizobium]RFC67052.1 DUF937 domain-containing protein [Mesorhizobium denitrificans]